MSSHDHVLVGRDESGLIGRITLDRPDARNALSTSMAHAMGQALAAFGKDDRVKVVVIEATGPDLTSGYDPEEAESAIRAAPGGSDDKIPSQRARLIAADAVWWGPEGLFNRLLHCRKVTILAAKGACLDPGLHLTLCADLVVADGTAHFAAARWRHLGVTGDISLLIAAVGLKRAKAMIYAGAAWDAVQAQNYGLLDEVVAPDQLQRSVTELADRCALVMRDAITAEKQVVFASLAKMQVGLGFAAASVIGGWGSNVHFRSGEFNFLRAVRDHGEAAAMAQAEAYFEDP